MLNRTILTQVTGANGVSCVLTAAVHTQLYVADGSVLGNFAEPVGTLLIGFGNLVEC